MNPNKQQPSGDQHELDVSSSIYDAFTKPILGTKSSSIDNEPSRAVSSSWLKFLLFSLLVLVLFAALIQWGFKTYQVDGTSMLNTYHDSDRLIVNAFGRTAARITGSTYTPQRGDVVTFTNPNNPDEQFIKRVIAFGGERVIVDDGKITVFDTSSNSNFPGVINPDNAYIDQLKKPLTGDVDTIVPSKHVFVAGDNRSPGGSFDSRTGLGTIPLENVQGVVVFKFYPL